MATPSKQRKVPSKTKPSSSPSSAKQKKSKLLESSSVSDLEAIGVDLEDSQQDSPVTAPIPAEKVPVFKDPNFVHSRVEASGNKKARVWKNLKQVVASEKSLPWQPDDTTYGMMDAPPSFKPSMKYSDLSGLQAYYTDPQTKLRYATAEEYSRIRLMPSDLVSGCLMLRKASVPV